MKKKYYRLSEYSYLYSNEYTNVKDEVNILLDKKEFDEIENFVLENKVDTEIGVTEFLIPSYKKGIGKLLKSKNYVGLIQTKNNTVIEILPKIYDENTSITYEKTIKIFFKMLKNCTDMHFKKYNISDLGTKNINLLDIFIKMFLQELSLLIKKGIRSGYVSVVENANFYKGKLLMNEQISNNLIHKEKFYIEHDEYIRNIAENKIIKSTLLYLNGITNNYSIQNNIRKCLFAMEDVDYSINIDDDFSKCRSNRLFSDYDMILKWCRIFLKKQSFINFKGSSNAYSLLFPMEKVFEKHVAACLKQSEYFKNYKIKTQDSAHSLIETPKRFSLRPDIVMKKDGEVFVLDTKWKLLNNDESSNYGISQSDLYQMFAYAKKYDSHNIFLIYPINDMVSKLNKEIIFNYDESLKLEIVFVDLDNIEESLRKLANRMEII